jgi:hypothetical protein
MPMKDGALAILISLALVGASAVAGEIYKCTGPDGEVTYTNVRCPDKSAVQNYGAYAPVPDHPSQMYEAARAADESRRHEAQEAAAAAAYAQAESEAQYRNQQGIMEDSRSSASVAPRNDGLKGHRSKQSAPAVLFDADPSRSASAPPGPQQTTASDCRAVGSGQVRCRSEDGAAQTGHVDVNGNATVWGNDGAHRLRTDGNGHLKGDDGRCVKDIYGQCQ